MNEKIRNITKGIMISVVALVVGYGAIAIPFNLYTSFTRDNVRIFFIIEMCLYLFIGAIFLLAMDKKEKQVKKNQIRHEKRLEKIKDVEENWYNIAA